MARLWYLPSAVIAVLMAVGAGGAYAEVLSPLLGFSLFFLGIGIALFGALILGAMSAFGAAWGKSWRPHAVRGAVLPMVVVLGLVLPRACDGVYPIHDVTTDPTDSLQFTPDVAALREAVPRDPALQLQRDVYPEVRPLLVRAPPDAAFAAAVAAAHATAGWEVTAEDPVSRRLQAVARTSLFHFEDDVAVRVRAEGKGSRIDVRSRSRIGHSDFGANAARIVSYLGAVQKRLR